MSKTILITGSSTGIGRAAAFKFQAEGWNVVATMRKPENESELNQLDHVLVTRLDVQDYASIEKAVQDSIDRFGGIDVVCNNAGYGLMGSFESASREAIQRQFDVNVFGLFDVTRVVLPHFRARRSGMFINISSIGGRMTMPMVSLYHATKFAVEGFSESAHFEWGEFGVQVKIVEPGAIATDFGTRSMDFQHNENLTEYNEYVGKVMAAFENVMNPENMSTPDVVADVIWTAATDGRDQMRYTAGPDAADLMAARKAMGDREFFDLVKTNFGLKEEEAVG